MSAKAIREYDGKKLIAKHLAQNPNFHSSAKSVQVRILPFPLFLLLLLLLLLLPIVSAVAADALCLWIGVNPDLVFVSLGFPFWISLLLAISLSIYCFF